MQRPVVAIEVLLAAETAVVDIADKCLGGVLSQGLLTSAAAGGGLGRSASIVGTRVGL